MNQQIHIDVDQPVSNLRGKLLSKSPWPAQCCIFRVPDRLCRHNQAVYEPKLVSIGPFHHHRENLQAMKKIKLWYLYCLLSRAPTIWTSLECFIESIRGNVELCRECYADELVNLSTDELVEMMVVDGCFIVELFRKYANIVQPHIDDPIFKMPWMRKNLLTDLLLLENQLPWFVLECLFNLTEADTFSQSLPELALNFFASNTLKVDNKQPNQMFQSKHLLDFQRNNLLSSFAVTKPEEASWNSIPCVTELLQAGVKFKKGEAEDILNIQFNNGVMTIPPIKILGNAESFIQNLIAYEQCDRGFNDIITSYGVMWDNLINSSKDLDFLREQGIIICYMSTEDLSSVFRRLCNDVDVTYYSYARVSCEINAYCESRWPQWRAILLRDYFSNPWSICSFIVAIVLLVMNSLQALYPIFNP